MTFYEQIFSESSLKIRSCIFTNLWTNLCKLKGIT